MKDDLKKLESKIKVPLEEMNIIIDNIDFVKEGNYLFLRIVLDKVNGLDIDTIVEATNVINPIVDELDLTNDPFILDVVSKEKGESKDGQ